MADAKAALARAPWLSWLVPWLALVWPLLWLSVHARVPWLSVLVVTSRVVLGL
jgi:hypothetical protein